MSEPSLNEEDWIDFESEMYDNTDYNNEKDEEWPEIGQYYTPNYNERD